MHHGFTVELLLIGVAATAGALFGFGKFLAGQSKQRRTDHVKSEKSRFSRERRKYIPRPFEDVKREHELARREFAARESHRRLLRQAFIPDSSAIEIGKAIEVGDTVCYAFKDSAERRITVTFSRNEHQPDRGIIHIGQPLAHALLRGENNAPARVGDELTISAGGQLKAIVILEIIKASSANTVSQPPTERPELG